MTKEKSILLQRGERGISIGHTGSGKTIGMIYQLQHSPLNNVIVFDTKGEPAFDGLARDDETIEFYESNADFVKIIDARKWPNYMIVRPSPAEMRDADLMDEMLQAIYERGKSCLVYIDEAYQWHNAGRAGAGLIGLLTRGRSKGISTLLSTQRPSWISRFCFSECQKFYIYRLTDIRDRKTVAGYVPDFDRVTVAKKFHFWYYDTSSENPIQLYAPVPEPPKRIKQDAPKKNEKGITWL